MTVIGDGLKDVVLAGVGAMALGAEKSKELIDTLISKGELTVDQGKEINQDLVNRADDLATGVRDDLIAAHLATMTKEQRDEFAARVADLAVQANERDAAMKEEAEEVAVAAEEEGAED